MRNRANVNAPLYTEMFFSSPRNVIAWIPALAIFLPFGLLLQVNIVDPQNGDILSLILNLAATEHFHINKQFKMVYCRYYCISKVLFYNVFVNIW